MEIVNITSTACMLKKKSHVIYFCLNVILQLNQQAETRDN